MTREIELKYRLKNHSDFERLKTSLGEPENIALQTNTFFDTKNFELQSNLIWLRIREANHSFTLTLKAAHHKPAPIVTPGLTRGPETPLNPGRTQGNALSDLCEYESRVSDQTAQAVLASQTPIQSLLKSLPESEARLFVNTLKTPLQIIGSFQNTRSVFPFSVGSFKLKLELDETLFGPKRTDYEFELEIPPNLPSEQAQKALLGLFDSLNLQVTPSTGKAQRFFAYLKSQANR